MSNAKIQFDNIIQSLNNLDAIYGYVTQHAPGLDASALLRSKYVFVVGAFDTYIHLVVIEKAIQQFLNHGVNQDCKLAISVYTMQSILDNYQNAPVQSQLLTVDLIESMYKYSYQSPDNVERALSLINVRNIWTTIMGNMNMTAKDIKDTLKIIVNRRNKIAHESDLDPLTLAPTPITNNDVVVCTTFISRLVTEIDNVV